ncbi:SctK family type III secretion system sorting platform protein [Glaciimonas sp. GG7]
MYFNEKNIDGDSWRNYSQTALALAKFRALPSQWMHVSWRDKFVDNSTLARMLFEGRHGHKALSRHVLHELNLTAEDTFDGTLPALTIAMTYSISELERIALFIGMILSADTVRQALSQESVAAWRECLGDSLHTFLCRQAPLLAGRKFFYTPYKLKPDEYLAAASESGYNLLRKACLGVPEVISQRFLLKLPRVPLVQISSVPEAVQQFSQYEVWPWIQRITVMKETIELTQHLVRPTSCA